MTDIPDGFFALLAEALSFLAVSDQARVVPSSAERETPARAARCLTARAGDCPGKNGLAGERQRERKAGERGVVSRRQHFRVFETSCADLLMPRSADRRLERACKKETAEACD